MFIHPSHTSIRIGLFAISLSLPSGAAHAACPPSLPTRAYLNCLNTELASAEARIDELEADNEELRAYLQIDTSTNSVIWSGANVYVQSGAGSTVAPVNGLGNLILGYDENDGADVKTGSHNLVTGTLSSYTGYGGIIGGANNSISDAYPVVLSGTDNTASGGYAVVITGSENRAGVASVVITGNENLASNTFSLVASGVNNQATGQRSAVFAGHDNEALDSESFVVGGQDNIASAGYAGVFGGAQNEAAAEYASVLGGTGGLASGREAAVVGGDSNEASGRASAVLGGAGITVSSDYVTSP